jgi:hypothetical protein
MLHKVHPAYRMVNAGRRAGGPLLKGYLLCVINSSLVFRLTFFKLAQLLWTHWRRTCDVLELFGHFSNLRVVELSNFTSMLAGGHCLIGYLLCVIKSSRTFRLTFFKPCTVVVDTLKMCMWFFGSVQTFFEKFACTVLPQNIANFCARPILALKRGWHYNEFAIFENSVVKRKWVKIFWYSYILWTNYFMHSHVHRTLFVLAHYLFLLMIGRYELRKYLFIKFQLVCCHAQQTLLQSPLQFLLLIL